MTFSRRKFLTSGALFGVAAALPLGLASMASAQTDDWKQEDGAELFGTTTTVNPYDAVGKLNKASFTPCLGSTFRFYAATKNVDLRLNSIKDVASATGKPVAGGECFDLSFQGPIGVVLPQNTYLVDHTKLGKFALFVVPVGNDGKNTYFEAVINRRLQ